TYFGYAIENGIIDDRFEGMENEPALRKYAAYIFAYVLPMEEINSVSYEDIPDLDEEYSYYISAVYNEGIIMGVDTMLTFSPEQTLLRCETAAIVTRCAVPDMRISDIEKSSYASSMPEAEYADGIIVVSYQGGSEGALSFHKKSENGVWQELITVPCYVGKNGIDKTAEGDGKTPTGTFSLGFAFGNEPEPGTELEYIQVDDSYYWVDDSNSAYYNQLVSANDVEPDWSSAEHIASYQTAYAYAINIEYNPDCIPGLGSAIFIHCSTDNPTSGCIAIDRDSMVKLINLATPDTVIVIGSEEE
ncbi:MAG: L,D-transpeptidase family protein, partial [Oscillospiraceae bacterium]|nr:L,D-transpeptidase family protein [Oscillospiraceae bacterium]